MSTDKQRADFFWSNSEEPHKQRNSEILKKYPQIQELFGHDPKTKWQVLGFISAQVILAALVRNQSWWVLVTVAYVLGAVAGQAIILAMHEISHNLLFESQWENKLFGLFANCFVGFPHFSMFQRYHLDHHQKQGSVKYDVDIPSYFEGQIFTNSFMKILWLFFQPLFYITRPLMVLPKPPGFFDILNWITVFTADYFISSYFGSKVVWYFFLSAFFGSGLHPVAGHFIAEHYVFTEGQETYSYYGPLNLVTFNVGYHNEHHDFPRIPGSRLPLVRKIAPEYYDNLASYDSYLKVIWRYITDPSIGPYSRVVRKEKKDSVDSKDKQE